MFNTFTDTNNDTVILREMSRVSIRRNQKT